MMRVEMPDIGPALALLILLVPWWGCARSSDEPTPARARTPAGGASKPTAPAVPDAPAPSRPEAQPEKVQVSLEDSLKQLLGIPDTFEASLVVVGRERMDSASAKRAVVRATVPEGLSREELVNNIKSLAAKELLRAGGAGSLGAVGVFVYRDAAEAGGAYSVARADFAPHGDWAAANDEAPITDWKLDYDIVDSYFKPLPALIEAGASVRFVETAMLSDDPDSAMDENRVVDARKGQKATVVKSLREHLSGGLYSVQYYVRLEMKRKTYEGWVDAGSLEVNE
ncbi:MAG: hypothetical protein H6746_20630 [Deltaproteobacteria bacterium]|nr:hypothetical protein [Deltaproteobacteria bacterium]